MRRAVTKVPMSTPATAAMPKLRFVPVESMMYCKRVGERGDEGQRGQRAPGRNRRRQDSRSQTRLPGTSRPINRPAAIWPLIGGTGHTLSAKQPAAPATIAGRKLARVPRQGRTSRARRQGDRMRRSLRNQEQQGAQERSAPQGHLCHNRNGDDDDQRAQIAAAQQYQRARGAGIRQHHAIAEKQAAKENHAARRTTVAGRSTWPGRPGRGRQHLRGDRPRSAKRARRCGPGGHRLCVAQLRGRWSGKSRSAARPPENQRPIRKSGRHDNAREDRHRHLGTCRGRVGAMNWPIGSPDAIGPGAGASYSTAR